MAEISPPLREDDGKPISVLKFSMVEILQPSCTSVSPSDQPEKDNKPGESVGAKINDTGDILPESSFKELPSQVLKFSQEEFDIVLKCCQHVDLSPRTLKRVINVYKLFKIIWFRSNRLKDNDLNSETKQAIVAFLALAGRYPNLMRSVFEDMEIRYEQQELNNKIIDSFSDKNSFGNDTYLSREWNRLRYDVESLKLGVLSLDQLGFERFNMLRSFCFVGDIGYDPDDFISSA